MRSSSARQEGHCSCLALERRAEPISGLYPGAGPLCHNRGNASERYVFPNPTDGEGREGLDAVLTHKLFSHSRPRSLFGEFANSLQVS